MRKSPSLRISLFMFLALGLLTALRAQTVIAGGGNYINGADFYLGTQSGSPSGLKLTYNGVGADTGKRNRGTESTECEFSASTRRTQNNLRQSLNF